MIETQRKLIRTLAEAWVGFPEHGFPPDSTDAQDPRGYLKRRYGIHDPKVQDAWIHRSPEPEVTDNDFEHADAKHMTVEYRKKVSEVRLHLQHVYRMAQLDRFSESLEALAKPRYCFASTLRDLVSWIETGADVFGAVNGIFADYKDIEKKLTFPSRQGGLHFGETGQYSISGWRTATAEAYRIFDGINFGDVDEEGQGQTRIMRSLAQCTDTLAGALSYIGQVAPQGYDGIGPDFRRMGEGFYMFGRAIERAIAGEE